MSNNTYRVEYASTGRSSCKQAKCKKQIEKGSVRIGAIFPSERFETDGVATDWFHPNCFFEKQKKARKTTKKVDDIDDLIGFDDLSKSDQKFIKSKVEEQHEFFLSKNVKSKPKSKSKKDSPVSKPKTSSWVVNENGDITTSDNEDEEHTQYIIKDKKKSNNSSSNNNNNSNKNKNKFDDDDLFNNNNDDLDDEIMKSVRKPTTTTTKTNNNKNNNNNNTTLIKSKPLKSLLMPSWLTNLEKIIKDDKQLYDEIIGDKRNSKCLPSESNQIFTSLNSVGSPKNCNVVIVGSSPDTKRLASSGFSYCDNSSERWRLQSIKTSHRNLIRLALLDLGYITKEETIDSIQEVLKEIDLPSDAPKDWFKSTSKQGVLWLNSTSLTSIEGDDDYESDSFKKHEKYWKPIIEEIIRSIFNSKIEDDSPSGVIFVLLGKQSTHFKQTIQLIHSEYMGAIPIEFIEGVSPVLETFIGSNCFKKINNSLEKLSLPPIDWWKPKEDYDDDEEEDQYEKNEEQEEEEQKQQKNVDDDNHEENEEKLKSNNNNNSSNNNNNNNSNNNNNNNRTIKLPPGEQFINDSNDNDDQEAPPNDKDNQNSNDNNNNDDENVPKCNLVQENGTKIQLKLGQAFTLGRTILDIRDKLVSRNQAIVTMLRDISTGSYFVELVPKGQNPVHLVLGDNDFQPLTQESKYKLYSGETFLLCSQKYPFTVEILGGSKKVNNKQQQPAISFSPKSKTTSNLSSQSPSSQSSNNNSISSNKRPLNNDYDDIEGEGYGGNKNHSSPAKKKIATPSKNSEKPKPKPKQKKKDDFIDEDDYQEEDEDSDDDYVPPQNDSDDDDYGPGFKPFIKSRSQDKPKCKYGSSCYRTNPDHLREFSHPPK
ncbi:hypothetical protein ACTFIU_005949 [Dictyostelium citrinum]